MNLKTILIVLLVSGCTIQADHGEPHRFTWSASEFADGYNLYCGAESGIHTVNTVIAGGDTVELLLADANVLDGPNYCLLTAFNFFGESDPTEEIFLIVRDGDSVSKSPATPINFSHQ